MVHGRIFVECTMKFVNWSITDRVDNVKSRMACYFEHILKLNIEGLVQERSTSIVNALELRLSCTNALICLFASTIRAE